MSRTNLGGQWPFILLMLVLMGTGVLITGLVVYNYPGLGFDRTIGLAGLGVAYIIGAASVGLSLRLERIIRRSSAGGEGRVPAEWQVELSKPVPGASIGIFLVVVVAVVLTLVIVPLPAGNTSLSLVMATSGLIFATLIYAYFTFGLVRVTDLARMEQIQPVVKASLWYLGPGSAVLRCQNIGRGSATDLEATIEVKPKASANPPKWVEPVLLPLGFRDFILPAIDFEELKLKVESVTVKGTCKDAFGRTNVIDTAVNIKDILGSISDTQMKLVDTIEDLLKKIAENSGELKHIEQRLNDLKGTVAGDSERNSASSTANGPKEQKP